MNLIAQAQTVIPSPTARPRVEGGSVSFYDLNDAIFNEGGERCNGVFQSIWCRITTIIDYRKFLTPGSLISTAFPYLFAIAGLILFVMIVWGGLEIMMGAASAKSADSGKQRITSAIIGFFILFSVFWIGQIVQIIFGLNIGLGGWGN